MRIAVIGSGISGSLAARLLATRHDVTVFEANDHPGGHAHTVDVEVRAQRYSVDTGFMVFNRRTYPNFCRLLEILEVTSQSSDMSFSVCCAETDWEYQGSSLNGLFAQRSNCRRPAFLGMLLDIVRFNRLARNAAAGDGWVDQQTVREFLRECCVGRTFIHRYFAPMASAIWSSRPQAILDFPARFMIRFLANHGLLQLRGRPQWRTIVGGSRNYVSRLLEPIRDQVRLRTPIAAVSRAEHHVTVTPVAAPAQRFDQVVFASHADQTLGMLQDPTTSERQILAAFPYQSNRAVLHTDHRLLPRRRRAWASWNYRIPPGDQQVASVTYDLSRLQNHRSPVPILLTLNASEEIAAEQELRTFTYHHPAYTRESLAAQGRWGEISGRNRTHFCGAYWGYGFHEDGVNSALAVAREFGIGLDACTAASTKGSSFITAANR